MFHQPSFTDGDIAFDICITSGKPAVSVDVQNITSRLDTSSVIEQLKHVDVKNIPGVISSLLILVALAFNLFNVKVMGMEMPVYPNTDVTNNLVITLIVILSIGAAFLFGLGLNRKYLKIINLALAAMFIALFVSAIISVNNINEAGNAARNMLGSMGMEDYEMPKLARIKPAFGYYLGVTGVLTNLYFIFIHKKYSSKSRI